MIISRRLFHKLALIGLPAVGSLEAINSKVDGVQLGVQSYSFRDLSFDDALKAMVTDGLGLCELFAPHIEGGHTDKPPMGFRQARTGCPARRTETVADECSVELLRRDKEAFR